MAGAGGICLNFRERAVFAEDRERFEEDVVVGARGPVGEVVDHEVGAEEIGPIAAGAVSLRGAGEIEFGGLQKFAARLLKPASSGSFVSFATERRGDTGPCRRADSG